MTILQRAGILLVTLLLACPLSAATFYVRTDGNDNNDGKANSSGRAFRTIQKGVDAMRGGDDLLIANGTYNVSGLIYIDGKSGTSSNRTVIKAINRRGVRIITSNKWGGIEVRNSNYITIDGFRVEHNSTNANNNAGTGIQSFDSDYVTFQWNYVRNFGCGGISFREGDFGVIQDNVVQDNAKLSNYNCSGISVYQPEQLNNNSGFHIVIRRNVAYENECNLPFNVGAGSFNEPTDGNGIILDDFNNTQRSGFAPYKAQTLVENNLVFNNGGAGIKVFEVDNATIRHNTAWHNNRILRNYGTSVGDISVTYSPGIFNVYNNISVSLNDSRCSALEYINTPGYGYMNRQSNMLVGDRRMPSDNTKWGQGGDQQQARSNQSYPQFVNATTSVGNRANPRDFDQFFRLLSASPGNNSGNNSYRSGNDLEGLSRPQNGTVERGCYETTVSGGTSQPTTSTQWIYRDGFTSGWANWSYGGSFTYRDSGIKRAGSYSMKFISNKSWGAMSLRHNGGKTGNNLNSLKFYARKWTDNPNYTARVRVRTQDDAGAKGWRNFSPGNGFVQYSFSKSQLGNPGTIKRIDINVPNGRTLWVDDIRLVYNSTSHGTVEVSVPMAEGTEEQLEMEPTMSVFPNPNNGSFTVKLNVPTARDDVRMIVTDMTGRTVDAANMNVYAGENNLRVNLNRDELPQGIYLVRFATPDGKVNLLERVVIR